MTNEELNTALYQKMAAELESYKGWLLSQSPEEILHHTYEYTIKQDIVMAAEENDFSNEQCKALLASPSPLADVFTAYERMETGYMEDIRNCIESRADDVIAQQRDASAVYRQSAHYAHEHGERDLYFASRDANFACRDAIVTAISENYDGRRLDSDAAKQVVEQFGMERTQYVLAATVRHKDWDARFDSQNKEWAKTIPFPDDKDALGTDRSAYYVVGQAHPGLVNIFVNQVRQMAKEREAERKPSVLDKLNKAKQSSGLAAPMPHKAKEKEL